MKPVEKFNYPDGLTPKELSFCKIIARNPSISYNMARKQAGFAAPSAATDMLEKTHILKFIADVRGKSLKAIDSTAKNLLKMAKSVEAKAMHRYLEDHAKADEKNALIASKSVKESLSKQGMTLYEAAEKEDSVETNLEIAKRLVGNQPEVHKLPSEGVVLVPEKDTEH